MQTEDFYGKKAIFTKQDAKLVAAYRRIQKFRIKTQEQLKAGWYMSIRLTESLSNSTAEVVRVAGKPYLGGSRSYRYMSINDIGPNAYGLENWSVSDLIFTNEAYRLNSKVEEFAKLFLEADRFQQYCVYNKMPYTQEVFDAWRVRMLGQEDMDDHWRQSTWDDHLSGDQDEDIQYD